jgi:uncharacterized protein (DUF1919 family)
MLPYRVEGPPGRAWDALARRVAERRRNEYQARLARSDFSIVCSNCWGAEAYRHLEVPYQTPFVGLFIEAPCYMRILRDLPGYLAAQLEFIERSRYPHINELRDSGKRARYPIGLLHGDAEVHFLHFDDPEEAAAKWTRRAERINWDNLLVSLLEYGPRDTAALAEFDALSQYHRKLVLTPERRPGISSAWQVRASFSNAASVYYQTLAQFDVVDWLNSGRIRAPERRGAARVLLPAG